MFDFVSERLDGQVLAFVSGPGGDRKIIFVAFFNDENGTISFNS